MIFKKLFKRRETEAEVRQRVLSLAKEGDYGMCTPPMDAQVALDELCRHLLGEDWYSCSSIHTAQVNTEIVYEIEMKYRKRVKRK